MSARARLLVSIALLVACVLVVLALASTQAPVDASGTKWHTVLAPLAAGNAYPGPGGPTPAPYPPPYPCSEQR